MPRAQVPLQDGRARSDEFGAICMAKLEAVKRFNA